MVSHPCAREGQKARFRLISRAFPRYSLILNFEFRTNIIQAGLGYMGKFLGTPNGTTLHLHFEIEAPVSKSVLLGPACLCQVGAANVFAYVAHAKRRRRSHRLCCLLRRSLRILSADQTDALTGLVVLPVLNNHEIVPATAARRRHR
jgi:hypothetical protein